MKALFFKLLFNQQLLRTRREEGGQVLVIGLIVILALAMVSISVANVGMVVAEKMHLQDTVDASAYSAAVVQARYMNLSAYVNRAMIANYNAMAFNTALWATVMADDHGMAVATAVLYEISAVLTLFVVTAAAGQALDQVADALRDYVHEPLHTINQKLDEWFAQDGEDFNKFLEQYNTDVLSMYQGMLYAAMQASRYDVIKNVAERMDPEVKTTTVLGLGAETVSFDELARAVDYVIHEPDTSSNNRKTAIFNHLNREFNEIFGTAEDESDHRHLLGAVTEASLDKFVAGRDRSGMEDLLRQFNLGNILGVSDAIDFVEDFLEVICVAISGAMLNFDPECSQEINLVIGNVMRYGQEDKASESRVPVMARRRMREVNALAFGLELDIHFPSPPPIFREAAEAAIDAITGSDDFSFSLDDLVKEAIESFLGPQGTSSGDRYADVANSVNTVIDLATLESALDDFDSFLSSDTYSRYVQCIAAGCLPPASLAVGIPLRGYNKMNMEMARMMSLGVLQPPIAADHQWDGTFDAMPVHFAEVIPPGPGIAEAAEYLGEVLGGAVGEGSALEEGVPRYDWRVNLDNVGIPHYIYPSDGATERPSGNSRGDNNNLMTGPTIVVIGVKDQEDVNGLRGLGIGNEYSMTAMSASQVYYVRNPKRPDEVPSLFNPHWVARLRPMDSDDTPEMIKEAFPYIAGLGIPFTPTH